MGGIPQPQILLVEDNEDTRNLYRIVLNHYGFDVLEATTGTEALMQAGAHQPDLILMDIGLPEMDGWHAARLIKADPATRHIPLLAFSALIDCTADLRSDVLTFDGFIAKPVSPSDLVRRLSAYLDLLAQIPRPQPEMLEPGPADGMAESQAR